MISLEDCIALSGLREEEIAAIAEHEHVPEVVALVLGHYLMQQSDGWERMKRMVVDDMRGALARGDKEHAGALLLALRHLISMQSRSKSPAAA